MRRTTVGSIGRLLVLATALVPCLTALNVKVVATDSKSGKVQLLLPMHSTTLKASVYPEGAPLRVRRNEFYDLKVFPLKGSNPHQTLLRIKIPNQKAAIFKLDTIIFLDK